MGGVKYEPAAVNDGAGGNVRQSRKMHYDVYDSRNSPDEFPGGEGPPQLIRDATNNRKIDTL